MEILGTSLIRSLLREFSLTAANLKTLLSALPTRVLKDIKNLSKETGESVENIVEKGVALYRTRAQSKLTQGEDTLSVLMRDPEKRKVFDEITSAMRNRSTLVMTHEQKRERATAGGEARSSALTPERRREIAVTASRAAKKKREEAKHDSRVSESDPVV
jgi:hypothetical protein